MMIFVLINLTIISMLCVSLAVSQQLEIKAQANYQQAMQALYDAETALKRVEQELIRGKIINCVYSSLSVNNKFCVLSADPWNILYKVEVWQRYKCKTIDNTSAKLVFYRVSSKVAAKLREPVQLSSSLLIPYRSGAVCNLQYAYGRHAIINGNFG